VRRLASARVEWRPCPHKQQLNSRVLSFGSCIGRRNFITLLGGAAAAARVAEPAQLMRGVWD
jgi:hypothetical protein